MEGLLVETALLHFHWLPLAIRGPTTRRPQPQPSLPYCDGRAIDGMITGVVGPYSLWPAISVVGETTQLPMTMAKDADTPTRMICQLCI